MERTHNQPVADDRRMKQFSSRVNKLEELINASKEYDSFKFFQKKKSYVVRASIRTKKIQDMLYRIILKGNDKFGDFSAHGYLVEKEEGTFLWFKKDYQDRVRASQTGDFHTLLYESTSFEGERIEGKWYYTGYEKSPDYSGRWQLQPLAFENEEELKLEADNQTDVKSALESIEKL